MGLLYDAVAKLCTLNENEVKRLSEAAQAAGKSLIEASAAVSTVCRYIANLAAENARVAVDIAERYRQPTDETLREVATGKEWHLMKKAKKARTRKKYRNRLMKRHYKEL